jgi:hypothetical protein
VLRLDRVAPVHALAVWTAALALRALVSVLAALLVVLVLPHSRILDAFSHWCWEGLLPLIGVRFELDGHRLGDTATVIPTLVVGISLLAGLVGVARAMRAIAQLVSRQAVGTGPRDSVIVGGADVVLACAGFAHPRILVSAGALIALEDDELAAGIAHEQGHIARRHRFLLLFAEVCRGLGRFVPGTHAACRALVFHLERDADRWALAQRHEPFVLARAICKAESAFGIGPVYAGLDGGCVPERIGQLVGEPAPGVPRAAPIRALATGMVVLTLCLVALAPGTAAAGFASLAKDHAAHQCEH